MHANHFISLINLYQWSLFIAIPLFTYCLVRIFKQLRRQFPIQVNCWFCNQNSTLPYDERNSFICPSCKQYNGFTEEGDYNKVIPEQQDELLNHIVSPRSLYSQGPSNGLCQICNNNQQLKIYQLANFVPLSKDNFDVEIEHFQKQLEKAYKLCPPCNFTVKSTIAKKNCTLLGRQIDEIRKSGQTLLNLSTTAKQKAIYRRRWLILCSMTFALPILACIMHGNHLNTSKLCTESLLLLNGYGRELMFALGGSLITMMFMRFTRRNTPEPTLINAKSIKKERCFTEKKSEARAGAGSYSYAQSQTQSDTSLGDLTYASFNSALNSTVRSDDGNSDNGYGDESRLSGNASLRKSPSAPSLYASFNTSQRSFASNYKSPLKITPHFQQLQLSAHTMDNKRPILSPAKFRNPWTGKPWDMEVSSRSSSQSSGVYSRATSICGDEVASLTTEPNLFKSVAYSLPTHSFSTIDNLSMSSHRY